MIEPVQVANMALLIDILLFFAISLLATYFYRKWPYDYWKKQGIEQSPESIIPVFGHTLPILCFRESLNDMCMRLYNKSTASMIGMFHLCTPVLIVREPKLVKSILLEKFNCFRNNFNSIDTDRNPFSAAHPFFAKDNLWKKHHNRFVKGMSSKQLKIMFDSTHRVALKFNMLLEDIEGEVDVKKLSSSFANEIVCNTGFGIEFDQTFAVIIKKISENTWSTRIKQLLLFFMPDFARILRLNFDTEEMLQYFGNLAKRIVDNETRSDNFVRMTMKSLEDVNQQSAMSLISGFYIDSSKSAANVINLALLRLSKHPELQIKVRQEIRETLKNGELSYELVNELKYTQQFINETLRLHPLLNVSGKICTETTTLHGSDGQICTLQPGHIVLLPAFGFQMDKRYWQDPETFNPDRFADQKKDQLIRYTYLAFGEGNRQCPGMRFGMIEIKLMLIIILRKYKLLTSSKTEFPLKKDTRNTLSSFLNPLFVNFVRDE